MNWSEYDACTLAEMEATRRLLSAMSREERQKIVKEMKKAISTTGKK